jgi:NAD(P)-dependent dehydrogenase (short-subunit alcohol dehydrogenase family)
MIYSSTPMRIGRLGRPEELARLLAFLASPDNGFTVGQTVYCDGGAEATLRPEKV